MNMRGPVTPDIYDPDFDEPREELSFEIGDHVHDDEGVTRPEVGDVDAA